MISISDTGTDERADTKAASIKEISLKLKDVRVNVQLEMEIVDTQNPDTNAEVVTELSKRLKDEETLEYEKIMISDQPG
jgi:hypothetical protein